MLTINGRGESGQDNFAFEFCGRKPNGTFLDIGCAEPIRWNNTYALEEVGWRGFLIDIDPDWSSMCKQQRKSIFIAADASHVDWRKLYGGPCLLDYLSLDVDENASRDRALTVLTNLIAAGINFRCATVEHDAYKNGDEPRNSIRRLLLSSGYTLAHANVEIRKGNRKPFEDWWTRA